MTDAGHNLSENNSWEELPVDAHFRLKLARDKLAVYMDGLQASSGGGNPVKVKEVYNKLKKLGVKYGIDNKKIDGILAVLNEGRLPVPERPAKTDTARDSDLARKENACGYLCIAKGDAPIHGQHASLQWLIDEEEAGDYVVSPGELIAIYHPPGQGKSGKNIFGKVMAAQPGRDETIKPGEGIEQTRVDGKVEYRAKWFGTLQSDDNTITVNCPLTISDDHMSATLDLLPLSSETRVLDFGHIAESLQQHKVTFGIKEDTLTEALATLNESGQPEIGVVAAEGVPVVHGVDARIIYKRKEKIVWQGLSKGRIDYREHNHSRGFKKGDTIGYLIDAKVEQDGVNVSGEVIKARPHKDLHLKLEGAHKDSHNKIVADVDGELIILGDHLKLTDLLVIDGDVAQRTGNIRSFADVHVKGHVEPGFELESQKSIVIDNNVEDAIVRCGGNITIKGGIRGLRSEVYAPGNVQVGFIENANVFVNGDITITGSIMNSKVSSNSAILVGARQSRHSAIIGGRTTAKTRVEAHVLGSSAYPKTIVSVGFTQETKQQQRDLRKRIAAKGSELVQLGQIESHYRNHAKADRDAVMHKVYTTRAALTKELGLLKEQLNKVMEQVKQSKDVRIVVYKKIFPGVTIKIKGHAYEVARELSGGILTLENDEVVFNPA